MNIKNFIILMKKLPLDIIMNHIIPYSYNIQNNLLLDDIKSYKLLSICEKEYNHIYIVDIVFSHQQNIDLHWLAYDLFLFLNKNESNSSKIHADFIHFIRRLCKMKNKKVKEIKKYIKFLCDHSIKKEINTYWGLMTKEDRINFIKSNNCQCTISDDLLEYYTNK